MSELSFLTAVHTAKGDRQARGNNRDFCLHRYDTMADPDCSSSSGWPYFNGVSMTTPPATAAEAPGPATQLSDALSACHLAWITATEFGTFMLLA